MANVLKKEKQLAVVQLLVEGNSIRSISRITGVNLRTILRILLKVGSACQELLDERMRDLTLEHVKVDEIWTFVGKKEGRIPVQEKDPLIGDQFLYIAIDEKTKLIATYAIGKRTWAMTRRFILDLAGRLVFPSPVASDARNYNAGGYEPIVQLSSDGLSYYRHAIREAFGPYAKHGVLIKDYRNSEMPGRYAAPEMIGTDRRDIFGIGEENLHTICTSHVERNNLTIRTFMRRFTRLSLGFSKKLENLAAAVALHVAHYNFCRVHGSLKKTPAMAAGVTGGIWTLEELYDKAMHGK